MKKLVIVLVIVALLLPVASPAFADTPYVVQRGDTLGSIAARFGVTVQSIINANGITNPNLIFVGQRLTIPTGGGPAPVADTFPVAPAVSGGRVSGMRVPRCGGPTAGIGPPSRGPCSCGQP